MAFAIPTLPDLAQRAANAFRTNMKGSDAQLWPNNVAVSAKVMAGAVSPAFSFLDYIRQQIFASSCDADTLLRHGAEYGMAPLPASFAAGKMTLSGTSGTVVPAGVVAQRADGVRYTVTAGGVVLGTGTGTVDVSVRAVAAGKAGNCQPNVGLSLTVPLFGIATDNVVAAGGIGLGADVESTENFRARVLFRKRMPPHGGAAHDYISWAREYNPGITRVFVDPVTSSNGRQSIGVWFLMDSTYVNGIPQAADVAGLAAYIDGVRPAGALVEVAAPVPLAINLTVAGLMPSTVDLQNAVNAELADLFARTARVSTLADPFTLYRTQVDAAISIARGQDHHTPTLPADIACTVGQIPTLGTVVFA